MQTISTWASISTTNESIEFDVTGFGECQSIANLGFIIRPCLLRCINQDRFAPTESLMNFLFSTFGATTSVVINNVGQNGIIIINAWIIFCRKCGSARQCCAAAFWPSVCPIKVVLWKCWCTDSVLYFANCLMNLN